MINTNNTNNYSNIIINNNGIGHDSKKNLKNKKLKISNSNNKDLNYLCRVNTDSRKCLFNNTKNIGGNNHDTNKSINNKNKKIFKNKNLFQSSIDNIHKEIKVSFLDKIINTNNNISNTNNKTEIKSDKNIIPNLKKNFDAVKSHLNYDGNVKNSSKKERNVKK